MTFIDWSDSEGMFGLLIELVADARNECQTDIKRQQFLSDLLIHLGALAPQFATMSGKKAINQLRSIQNSIDPEFEKDPVILHVKACVEELERVHDLRTGER